MEKIIAAFGLVNEKELTDKHFGDSLYFDLYEIRRDGFKKIKRVDNVKLEEKIHGDPRKAGKIGSLLKEADVLVAFRMGPNILRMKKNFVPVIVNSRDFIKSVKTVMANFETILSEVSKIGEKNYITLKVKED